MRSKPKTSKFFHLHRLHSPLVYASSILPIASMSLSNEILTLIAPVIPFSQPTYSSTSYPNIMEGRSSQTFQGWYGFWYWHWTTFLLLAAQENLSLNDFTSYLWMNFHLQINDSCGFLYCGDTQEAKLLIPRRPPIHFPFLAYVSKYPLTIISLPSPFFYI